MSTVTTNLPAPIVGKFNIALSETKFQQLADEADRLVFTEDNLEKIKEFLDKTKKVVRAIENTHKEGKAEALEIGRAWDAAKNSFTAQVNAITLNASTQYDKICRDVQLRAAQAAAEKLRKENIKLGIENNAVNFAKRIAECTTSKELTAIESVINLEKGRKEKYQEFLEEAVEKFSQLNGILKTQKETVREMEKLVEEKLQAEKEGNDALLLEIQNKQDIAETKIEERKIEVQETAISQSMNSVIEPEIILPTVKARRTTVKWKVIDIAAVAKKMPHWVTMIPKEEPIDDYLKSIKELVLREDKVIFSGIEFYTEKTF